MNYLLLLLLCLPLSALSQVDVVYDLDWTLVYTVDDSMAGKPRVYEVEGQFYRLADGAEEVIAEIYHNPDMRVSFFSGGEKSRNRKLLKQIFLPNSNISFYEAAHKVLNRGDLTVSSTDASLSFTDRYKKDLLKVNEDLGRIVLIDDLKEFAPAGQAKNMFWLGQTYSYSPSFSEASFGPYAPKTEIAWLHERNKLFWSFDAILKAKENSQTSGRTFVRELRAILEEQSPRFPTMNKIRKTQTLIHRLEEKYRMTRAEAPKSLLNCASFFFP